MPASGRVDCKYVLTHPAQLSAALPVVLGLFYYCAIGT